MRTPDDIYDELLVLRGQDRDLAAIAELAGRWQPRLLRHAHRLTGSPDAASDVVQAVWVAILRGLNGLEDPACFRRWAYQITSHKCADWVRERQRDRAGSVSLASEPIDQKTEPSPSQGDTELLAEALKRLPGDHRTILSMFYLDHMPILEIAESLSLPMGTVKSRLHYARAKLKELLERENV